MPKLLAAAIGGAWIYAGSVDMFYAAHWSLIGMPALLIGMLVLSTIERKGI